MFNLVSLNTPSSLNIRLFYLINHNLKNFFFDLLMPYLTQLGGFFFIFSLTLFVILLALKNKKFQNLSVSWGIAFVLTTVLIIISKSFFQTPRPYANLGNINLFLNGSWQIVSFQSSLIIDPFLPYSFPSGHALWSFAFLGTFWRVKKIRWLILTLSILIAFSRIYLGVHYPFDVIAGGAIGFFAGFAIKTIVVKKFDKKGGTKNGKTS